MPTFNANFSVEFDWYDLEQQHTRQHLWPAGFDYATASTSAGVVQAALQNVSCLGLDNTYVGSEKSTPTALPTVGDYDDTEDRAVFLFRSANGYEVQVNIPAPKATVFLADDETIDSAQADVASFITGCQSQLCAHDGSALAEYVRGYRQRSRTRGREKGFKV